MMRDQQGFSLVEVMIALGVFAVGILAVQHMQFTSVATNFNAFDITRGVGQGVDTVERLLALDYNDPLLAGDTVTPVQHDNTEFPADWKMMDLATVVWQVTDDTPMPNMKTIEVTVTSTAKAANRINTITYYKAEII